MTTTADPDNLIANIEMYVVTLEHSLWWDRNGNEYEKHYAVKNLGDGTSWR
jgi:hypothetical protein